jgi:mannose-1-phosphate guanylyltransferase/mannose-6-phosphate isomerase
MLRRGRYDAVCDLEGGKVPILPVIMSGGAGTRLWPISTEDRPKQFHAFGGAATMLQETALRVRPPEFLDPLVVCNVRHGALVRQQLHDVGVRPADVIMEPFGRNTCAVAVVAADWAARHADGAAVLLMPADHVIRDAALFREKVLAALDAVGDDIVTFGIAPTGPETGYGYIKSGESLGAGIHRISRFIEKPERADAERYLADGGYSWNAGIFLFSPALLLQEARRYCPDIVDASLAAVAAATADPSGQVLDGAAFEACPSIPIDVAIMEKTLHSAVSPLDVGWVDIGSWSELWRNSTGDDAGNVRRGDTAHLEASGSLLWSNGPTISVIGLDNIMVIATADHVLVLPKERAQDVKKIVENRKADS